MSIEPRKLVALSGAIALALGMAIGVSIGKDDADAIRTQKIEALGDALAAGSASLKESDGLDTAAYHRAVRDVRALDVFVVDLLTAPVAPGAEVTTGVTLPTGARVVGPVTYTGAAAGSFTTVSITYNDKPGTTWCEIRARNTSSMVQRMTALIGYEVR